MTARSVADMPALANATQELERVFGFVKKVPLRIWRDLITALALIWVCHILAGLFWRVFPTPELPLPPVVATKAAPASSGGSDVNIDVESIQALNLLGEFNASAPIEVPDQQPQDLEPTKLNLELQGILASSDPKFSSAIIAKGNDQNLYKTGEEIEGNRGVKVAEIHAKKVILDNRGKLEVLWLYGEDGTSVASSSPVRSRVETPTARPEPQTASVSAEQIKQARNIGDVVRFMVATENGKMIGYKVRPGRQRELFDQVGLKTDDIVVSVNGIEVNEPQKVREVYQALKTATEANLEVMRDGTQHSITITMSSEG